MQRREQLVESSGSQSLPYRPQPYLPFGALGQHCSPSAPTDPHSLSQGLVMSQLSLLSPNGLRASPFSSLLPEVCSMGMLIGCL